MDISQRIQEMLSHIESTKQKVVAKENEDPERTSSGWGDLNLSPLQLFIEHSITDGRGYNDSFYWNIGMPMTDYQKVQLQFRHQEIQDEWSKLDLRQFPYISPITQSS